MLIVVACTFGYTLFDSGALVFHAVYLVTLSCLHDSLDLELFKSHQRDKTAFVLEIGPGLGILRLRPRLKVGFLLFFAQCIVDDPEAGSPANVSKKKD